MKTFRTLVNALRLNWVVTLTMILFAMLFLTACTKQQTSAAADASAKVASSLGAFQDVTVKLYDQRFIDKSEAKTLSEFVIAGTQANDAFVHCVRGLKGLPANIAQPAALACFDELSTTIAKMNDDGVLRVKNPEAKQRLAIAFQAISAAVQGYKVLLDQFSTKQVSFVRYESLTPLLFYPGEQRRERLVALTRA